MLNEKEKANNINKPEPHEAVKLSCGLGGYAIKLLTSFITLSANDIELLQISLSG